MSLVDNIERQMPSLIVNNSGLLGESLQDFMKQDAIDFVAVNIQPFTIQHNDEEKESVQEALYEKAKEGCSFKNIFINCVDGFNEIEDYKSDFIGSIRKTQFVLTEMLTVLKYSAQHLMRGDGGSIWVLCLDQGASYSVDTPYNPIMNNAMVAAVRSLAKEVARFNITVNVFMIQPPSELADQTVWRGAKNNLKAFSMKFKPNPIKKVAEVLCMYSKMTSPPLSGVVIPIGTGFIEHNY